MTTQSEVQERGPNHVTLVTLATCHVAGLFGQLLPSLRTGSTCILHARYDGVAAALEVDRSGVIRIRLLPAQLAALVDAALRYRTAPRPAP